MMSVTAAEIPRLKITLALTDAILVSIGQIASQAEGCCKSVARSGRALTGLKAGEMATSTIGPESC